MYSIFLEIKKELEEEKEESKKSKNIERKVGRNIKEIVGFDEMLALMLLLRKI